MNNEVLEDGPKKEVKLVVTGFGLFRDHSLNPSWEAIKDGELKIDRPGVSVITKQLDVAYDEVDSIVPALWEEHKPSLMIHVGLAAHDDRLRLEQFARHGPYIYDDVRNHAPHKHLRQISETSQSVEENSVKHNFTCKPCKFDCSSTCVDVDRICDKMNEAFELGKIKIPTGKSMDAGLFVCEYVYHKSLVISDRTIFIHVPNVGDYKIEDIREALKCCIEIMIDEILPSLLMFE